MNRFEEMFWATKPALEFIEAMYEASRQIDRKQYEAQKKWFDRRKNMTVNQKVATAHMVRAMINEYKYQYRGNMGELLFSILIYNQCDDDSLRQFIDSIENIVGTDYDIVAREIVCWLFEFKEDERKMILNEDSSLTRELLEEYIRYKTIYGEKQ